MAGRRGCVAGIIGASLGHADLRSMQVYARLTMEPIRQSVDKATLAMLEAGGVKLPAAEKGGNDE